MDITSNTIYGYLLFTFLFLIVLLSITVDNNIVERLVANDRVFVIQPKSVGTKTDYYYRSDHYPIYYTCYDDSLRIY